MASNSAQRYDPDDPVKKELDDWPELRPGYKPPRPTRSAVMASIRRHVAVGSSVDKIVQLMKTHTAISKRRYFAVPHKPEPAPKTSVYFDIPKEDS